MHSFLLKTRGELQWLSTEFEKNNWIRRLRLIKTKGENPSFSAAEYKVFPLVFFKSKKIEFNLPVTYERWGFFFSLGFSFMVGFCLFWLKMKKKKRKHKEKKAIRPAAHTIKYIHKQHTLLQLEKFNFAVVFTKFKWQDSLPHSTEQK